MNLRTLVYGSYTNYCAGDGSLYDHCISYNKSMPIFAIFSQDEDHYYNLLEDGKVYNKKHSYEDFSLTIDGPLLDIMPYGIDPDSNCSINDIILLLPAKIAIDIIIETEKNRVLQLL